MTFSLFHEPEADNLRSGLGFVDVLFALVVGAVLQHLQEPWKVGGATLAHLVLAGAATVSSWIGYRNSASRSEFKIRFVNLPFLQFAIDILLVALYWVLANGVEGLKGSPRQVPTYKLEVAAVFAAFCLYLAWDLVGLLMHGNDKYQFKNENLPARQKVTVAFTTVVMVLWVVLTVREQSHHAPTVIAVDVMLIALVLAYRVVKDGFHATATGVVTAGAEPPARDEGPPSTSTGTGRR